MGRFARRTRTRTHRGWQLTVELHNRGSVTAYEPTLWVADKQGNPLTHKYGGRGDLAPGEPGKLSVPDGNLRVLIGGREASGSHEREVGHV